MFFYNSQEADFAKWACRKNNRVFCLTSVNYFHFKNVIYQTRDMSESWMSDTLSNYSVKLSPQKQASDTEQAKAEDIDHQCCHARQTKPRINCA